MSYSVLGHGMPTSCTLTLALHLFYFVLFCFILNFCTFPVKQHSVLVQFDYWCLIFFLFQIQDCTTSTPSMLPMHSDSICLSSRRSRSGTGNTKGCPPVATKSNIRRVGKTIKRKVVRIINYYY